MRMRRKKNLDSRLQAVQDVIVDYGEITGGLPNEPFRGEMLDLAALFGNENELHLEIGCGKGQFAAELAARHPEINVLAVEVNRNVIVQACEKAKQAGLSNLRFLIVDAQKLGVLLPPGSVSRIYLNFSCPFPKKRQEKRRLTHESFLRLYRTLLKEGGQIHQKTDNKILFASSIEQFSKCGFLLSEISLDLHENCPEDNIMTEYEKRFVALGQPIYRLVATAQ